MAPSWGGGDLKSFDCGCASGGLAITGAVFDVNRYPSKQKLKMDLKSGELVSALLLWVTGRTPVKPAFILAHVFQTRVNVNQRLLGTSVSDKPRESIKASAKADELFPRQVSASYPTFQSQCGSPSVDRCHCRLSSSTVSKYDNTSFVSFPERGITPSYCAESPPFVSVLSII